MEVGSRGISWSRGRGGGVLFFLVFFFFLFFFLTIIFLHVMELGEPLAVFTWQALQWISFSHNVASAFKARYVPSSFPSVDKSPPSTPNPVRAVLFPPVPGNQYLNGSSPGSPFLICSLRPALTDRHLCGSVERHAVAVSYGLKAELELKASRHSTRLPY